MAGFTAHNARTATTPIPTPRSTRLHDVRALTSIPAGRVVPLVGIPLLRMDGLRNGRFRLSFEMLETAEILLNAVAVSVKAHLVPYLAFDRFDGMDALNRSYAGVAVEGLPMVPFFETVPKAAPNVDLIHKYLGLHFKDGQPVNTAYIEAYNQIWNMRARNRSRDLNLRSRLQTDLAPAFWLHQHFKHIVPDFDQALVDGEVPLNITSQTVPISGIGIKVGNDTATTVPAQFKESDGFIANYPEYKSGGDAGLGIRTITAAGTHYPNVYLGLDENSITVSLSNIEMARKTAFFARLRERYAGQTDDYIIDLLMQGISVPEQALNQPILLAEKTTIFGMSKRYSTDADAMTESVVNGATFMDLTVRCPPISTGGIVMITAEILPEQLFERQLDPLLGVSLVDQLPAYDRDELDPEKVSVVPNGYIDQSHSTPNGTFGYAPLNFQWMVQQPRLGGKFHRPTAVETNDEDRQRVWAVETVDPTLAADFYISTAIHTKPFVVQNVDPFEVMTRGLCQIEGNTVFGRALIESSGSYEEMMERVPMDRIDKPEATAKLPPPTPKDAEVVPPSKKAESKPKPKAAE